MIIQNLHIVHFGKLNDFSLSLDPTLHIIEGENEAGKSTIAAFVRFMLYGLDKSDPVSCEKAISRDSRTAEGTMTIQVREGVFRLERKATLTGGTPERPVYEESGVIVNTATGEETEGISAGQRWFGFPASIYRRIACIGQLTEQKVDDAAMRQSIENLLFSGDEKINIRHATAILSARRDKLMSVDRKSGEIPRLKTEADELRHKLDRAVSQNHQVMVTQAKLDNTRRKLRKAEKDLQDMIDRDDKSRYEQLRDAFDQYHELKNQTREVGDKLIELRKGVGRVGFIPDADYLTELGVERRLYAEALASCKQAGEDLQETESSEVIEADVQRYLRQTFRQGGEDQVLADTHALHRRTVTFALLGVLCAVLLCGCIVLGARFLPPLIAANGTSGAIGWILALSVGCLLLAGGDVALWLLARAGKQQETALYIDYAAHNYREMLTRIHRIIDYRRQAADRLMKVRAAQKYQEKTVNTVTSAYEVLARTLQRWGGDVPPQDGDVLGYTDKIMEAARNYLDTLAALNEEKTRLDVLSAQLRDQLRGQNEEVIRKKVAEKEGVSVGKLTPEEITAGIANYRHQCNLLRKSEEMLDSQYTVQKEQAEEPARIAERLAEAEAKLSDAVEEHRALEMALSTFLDVDDRLKARIVPRLAENAKELICTMTGGTYSDIELGDDLSLRLKLGEEAYTTDLVSAGTRDIAYISLRMAMISMLCRDELPPLCLDESFAYQDDTRSLNMMKMLKAQSERGMQTLVFTCRAREEILAHQAFGPRVGYTHLPPVNGR